ncbi:MAG: hypothetical protein WCE21_05850 [Candidatus Babeliales bacterium]
MNTHKIYLFALLAVLASMPIIIFGSEEAKETVLVLCDQITSGNAFSTCEKNGITDNRPTNILQRDNTRIQSIANELHRKVTDYNDKMVIDNCNVQYLCLNETSLGQASDVNQLSTYINTMDAPKGIILVAVGAQASTAVNYLATVPNSIGKDKLLRGFVAINPLLNPNEATFHWIANLGTANQKRASYIPFSRLFAPLMATRTNGARSYNPWFGLNPLASAKKLPKDASIMIIQTTDNPITPANQGWQLYQALPEGNKSIIELNSNVNAFPIQNHTYTQLEKFRIGKDTEEKTQKGSAVNRNEQKKQLQRLIVEEQQASYEALQKFFIDNELLNHTAPQNSNTQSSIDTQPKSDFTQKKINFYRSLPWRSNWTRNIIDGATACGILASVSYLIYKKTRA